MKESLPVRKRLRTKTSIAGLSTSHASSSQTPVQRSKQLTPLVDTEEKDDVEDAPALDQAMAVAAVVAMAGAAISSSFDSSTDTHKPKLLRCDADVFPVSPPEPAESSTEVPSAIPQQDVEMIQLPTWNCQACCHPL